MKRFKKWLQWHILTRYRFSTAFPEDYKVGEISQFVGKKFVVTHIHKTVQSWLRIMPDKDGTVREIYDVWGYRIL